MRRGEVGALKRSYVTPEAITLPPELTKNGRELVLPNLINAELSAIPSVGNSDYFFPTAAGGPFCSWGKNKIQVRQTLRCQQLDAARHPADGADETCGVGMLRRRDSGAHSRARLGGVAHQPHLQSLEAFPADESCSRGVRAEARGLDCCILNDLSSRCHWHQTQGRCNGSNSERCND